MNDKNRQRHIAYEVLVILGQLALLTYITRLWPILLLIILGIFVAALRLLFLSSQKVEPVRPLLTLPPPHQPPTEKDLQSAAYTIVQCRITQILSAKFPEARWVWENPRAMEDILAGNINIVDSFLQGVPAKQKYIFQPALRRQKPRVNKKCHLPKKQMTLIENSETTFCLRKTLILC